MEGRETFWDAFSECRPSEQSGERLSDLKRIAVLNGLGGNFRIGAHYSALAKESRSSRTKFKVSLWRSYGLELAEVSLEMKLKCNFIERNTQVGGYQ